MPDKCPKMLRFPPHKNPEAFVSFREEEDEYALYVHEDFMTNKNKLVRYTIDKEELQEYATQ